MSTPSPTPETDAAKYNSQPGNPMCPNGIMVVPAEVAEKIVALRGEVESALKFLESRFGNEEGRDWGDAAAGDVADFLEEVLTTPPPAVAPLEDVRPLADAVAYTLSHHNEDGEGSIEKLQHTLSTFTAKHPL